MQNYKVMPKVAAKSKNKSNKMIKMVVAGLIGLAVGYLSPFALFGWLYS